MTRRAVTSVVGVAELLRGVYVLPKGRSQQELMELFRQVIAQMEEILPITPAVAEKFAEVDSALRRKGRPIPTNDAWVAAVALDRGAILVTNDNHFSYVDDLPTENWIA